MNRESTENVPVPFQENRLSLVSSRGNIAWLSYTTYASSTSVQFDTGGILGHEAFLHEGGAISQSVMLVMDRNNPASAIHLVDASTGLTIDTIPIEWDESTISLVDKDDKYKPRNLLIVITLSLISK